LVQLRTERAAFILYGVLLVLPTVVLGWLQWRAIVREKESELADLPRKSADAAERFRAVMRQRLEELVASEQQRGVDQYAWYYCPESTPEGELTLLPTPLSTEARPAGVLAWFVFDMNQPLATRLGADGDGSTGPEVDVFFGSDAAAEAERAGEIAAATRELLARFEADGWLRRAARMGVEYRTLDLPLRALAASQASETDEECLRVQRMLLAGTRVPMITGPFHVQFYLDRAGVPRLVATRRVLAKEMPQLVGANECVARLSRGLGLVQGFFIDPRWYFDELPSTLARTVLDQRERLVRAGEACGDPSFCAEIRPVADLELETYEAGEKDFGLLRIAVGSEDVERRFEQRAWRFGVMAAMLAIALGTGIALLWRSVQAEVAQAQRAENFVAAVTHELRTPLSSIKLHGEMLLEGWAQEPAKQQEYYRRIVRETGRLSTLVERVLEKARLTAGPPPPIVGDLSRLVGDAASQLEREGDGERPDLALDLAADLPPVLLTAEAVQSIVTNLVENARKYAPVDLAAPQAEPIRVVTRRERDHVVLEVLDRGPGVPPQERERIFDAFYRVGNEATRTARGTGLGLHLVALHARALGAKAEALERPGGGSIFRVTFRTAPPPAA
jgi:signal transduction histidine kinase